MISRTDAERLDRLSPLRQARQRVPTPDGLIYLDGNSLGPPPHGVLDRVATAITQSWGHDLIASWNTAGWIDLTARVGDRIARLIGAPAGCVMAGDSTSVQWTNLLVAACRLRPERSVIVTDASGFPTDGYLIDAVARTLNLVVRRVDAADADARGAAITTDVAVVALGHVDYRTGVMLDLADVTAHTHAVGAVTLWDLAHSVGVVDLDLLEADADLAVGCTYKYLNGGPGAPAFGFVHPRWQETLDPLLSGWFGHAAPFALEPEYRPAAGVGRLRIGTPPILSLVALDAALDAFDDVSMTDVRDASLQLTDSFIAHVEARCPQVEVVAPRSPAARGSQVCLRHPSAYALVRALSDCGVVGDYREPDLARFGFSPLVISLTDVLDAVDALNSVLVNETWRNPEFSIRAAVT